MGLRRKRRPICQHAEETGEVLIECQRYAIVTVEGVHYCEKHADEAEEVPYY